MPSNTIQLFLFDIGRLLLGLCKNSVFCPNAISLRNIKKLYIFENENNLFLLLTRKMIYMTILLCRQ